MSIDVSHLVVLGCSFTYGQGLTDPKQEAWAAILANKLNVPIVNLASLGSGNDRIMRKLFEYHYLDSTDNNPLYIVAFSHSSRREEYIFDEYDYRIVDMHPDVFPKNDYDFSKSAIANYNQEIASAKKLMIQSFILDLFKANNINYFITDFMPDKDDDLNAIERVYPTAYNKVYNDPYRLMDFGIFSGNYTPLKCGHDGPEAQQAIANYAYDEAMARFGGINSVDKSFVSLKEYHDHYAKVGSYLGENAWL